MIIFLIIVAIVIMGTNWVFTGNVFCISKERRFLRQKCSKGGKHDVKYESFGFTYQEIKCSKCGKSVIIDKN